MSILQLKVLNPLTMAGHPVFIWNGEKSLSWEQASQNGSLSDDMREIFHAAATKLAEEVWKGRSLPDFERETFQAFPRLGPEKGKEELGGIPKAVMIVK